MSDSRPTTLNGWVLCRDHRLARLLETELFYLGVTAVTYPTLPPPSEDVCILVADGDEFGIDACISLAAACDCSLLVFGRKESTLPEDRVRGCFLRRPFALPALGKAVRILLPASAPLYLPGFPGHEPPIPEKDTEPPATSPALTARDGVVTVGKHTVTLTPAEWAIFEYLNARPGETVTRDELATLLGGGGNIVDVYVCRLRSKIEKPLGRRMITTVRGQGYRMEM